MDGSRSLAGADVPAALSEAGFVPVVGRLGRKRKERGSDEEGAENHGVVEIRENKVIKGRQRKTGARKQERKGKKKKKGRWKEEGKKKKGGEGERRTKGEITRTREDLSTPFRG